MKKINTKNKNGIVFENFFKFLLEQYFEIENIEHKSNTIFDYDIKANGIKFEIKGSFPKKYNIIGGISLNHNFDYLIVFVYKNEKLKYTILKKEEIKEKITLTKRTDGRIQARIKQKYLKDINSIITELQDILNIQKRALFNAEVLFNLYFANQLIKCDNVNFHRQYKDLISNKYNLKIASHISKNRFNFRRINNQLNKKPYLLIGIKNDIYYVIVINQNDYHYKPKLNKTFCLINGKVRKNKGNIFDIGIQKNLFFEGTLKEVLETYGKKGVKND